MKTTSRSCFACGENQPIPRDLAEYLAEDPRREHNHPDLRVQRVHFLSLAGSPVYCCKACRSGSKMKDGKKAWKRKPIPTTITSLDRAHAKAYRDFLDGKLYPDPGRPVDPTKNPNIRSTFSTPDGMKVEGRLKDAKILKIPT